MYFTAPTFSTPNGIFSKPADLSLAEALAEVRRVPERAIFDEAGRLVRDTVPGTLRVRIERA